MTTPWEAVGLWPVRAMLAGGVVLLAGRLALMALTKQPARRAWVGMAAVATALLADPADVDPRVGASDRADRRGRRCAGIGTGADSAG